MSPAASRRSRAVHARAWVFTSATLSVGEDFTHFTSRLGLADGGDARHCQPVRLRIAGAALSTAGDAGAVGARAHPGGDRRGRCRSSRPRPAAPSCCSRVIAPCSAPRTAARALGRARRLSAAGAGRGAARAAAAAFPRVRQRGAARHGELLGRRRREGRRVAARRHREAAVRLAGRCAREGAHRAPESDRRQRVSRIPAARSGARAEAGRRPAHSQRDGSRRGGHLRSAPRRQTLRARVPRASAADASHARRAPMPRNSCAASPASRARVAGLVREPLDGETA